MKYKTKYCFFKNAFLLSLFALSIAPGYSAPDSYEWPKSRMPIPVCIQSGKGIPGFRPELENILKQAFDEWMIASGGKIQFVFVDKTDGGQGITVKWINDRAKLASNAEDGETMVVPDAQGINMANVTLLTVPPKTMPTLTANYARRVALHEVGHALGIATHSASSSDIMFGTIYPEDKPCALTAGDTSALMAIYNAPPKPTATSDQLPGQTEKVTPVNAVVLNEAPSVKALRLNNEAADLMQKAKFDDARVKLEEAVKLTPDNGLIAGNLGLLYSNLAAMSLMQGNPAQAEIYSKKSLPLVEKYSTRANLMQVLKAQGLILHMLGKEADAKQIEARMSALSKSK